MKKFTIVLLVVALGSTALAGCSTIPPAFPPENLVGEWRQVDGSMVLNFYGKKFTVLDMENGYAGEGTYKPEKSKFRLKFEVLYMHRSVRTDGMTKFQKEAFAEYHLMHPGLAEELRAELGNLQTDGSYDILMEFSLETNILYIEECDFIDKAKGIYREFWKHFQGQFVRSLGQ